MRTIIGLLIFAALLWVALHWSLFSILFMALMLVIAISVVRMSHHVSPIDFYRIGFAIRTGALFVVGFIFGIIRFVLGMLILAGVIWAAGWGIGKIGDWAAKPAVEAAAVTQPKPAEANTPPGWDLWPSTDVVDPLKMLSKDQVFDQCARMHDERMEIHWCMVANGYAGKWECEAAACFFKPSTTSDEVRIKKELDVSFHNMEKGELEFNKCASTGGNNMDIHRCMLAKGYELDRMACKTFSPLCYILGMQARRRQQQ